MKAITPYLTFDGNAREAMTFYHECLGGNLAVQTFGDVDAKRWPGAENRVMHASLTNGSAQLMASDTPPGSTFAQGNNVHVTIDCETVAEIDKFFGGLSTGGKVTMPLGDTFWGARFGQLTDKFGVNWMLNCYLKS